MPTDYEMLSEYHALGLETILSERQFIYWFKEGQKAMMIHKEQVNTPTNQKKWREINAD